MAVLVIDPGECNPTLCVLSDGVPGTITDNVINGTTGSGNMIRPASKPATVALLGMGSLPLLIHRCRG